MLEQVKTNPELKRIPVVIFTSSEAEEDILGAYDLHVNCYITKPVRLEQFSMVLNVDRKFLVWPLFNYRITIENERGTDKDSPH